MHDARRGATGRGRGGCNECGFRPPDRVAAASALRSLGAEWASALEAADPAVGPQAARVRDELHAVANRVARLLDTPGAELPPVRVQPAGARSRSVPGELRGALLHVEAERLAEVVEGLSPEEWRVSGRIGGSPVTIAELVAAPLHSSHRFRALARPRTQ
jgi:hypothetical protein